MIPQVMPSPPAQALLNKGGDPGQIRVLLVQQNGEDDQELRELLSNAGAGVFELEFASDLSTGLRLISEDAADLVLLDISPADGSGLDGLALIEVQTPRVPVVVLTGRNGELLAAAAIRAGAQDHLRKNNLDSELLTRSVRHAIERSRILAKLERNKRELEASEAQFRSLVESNADGIAVVDRGGFIRFVNPALGTLFGRDTEDLLCEPFGFPVLPGETAEICIPVKGKGLCTAEIRVVETVWEEEEVYLVSLRDVTDRKQAEAQLKLRALLLDAATDSIYLHNSDGNIEYANESAYRTRGFTKEEFLRLNFYGDVVAPESSRHPQERVGGLTNNGSASFQSVHVRKDGSRLPVEVHSRFIEWEGRRLSLSVSRDISERNRSQEELKRSFDRLQKVLDGTVQAIASMVEMRDPYTAGHERRVAQLACAIANELGLSEDRIEGIRIAGLLHDIGKICIPSEILNKPGTISQIELSLLKTHPRFGYEILSSIEFPWPVATIVLQHHERLNGSGYPCGIFGDEILLDARILAVADVVEAMSSYRPYRPALGTDKAFEEIARNCGTLYDWDVVEKCLLLFQKKEFRFTVADRLSPGGEDWPGDGLE